MAGAADAQASDVTDMIVGTSDWFVSVFILIGFSEAFGKLDRLIFFLILEPLASLRCSLRGVLLCVRLTGLGFIFSG